LNAHCIDINQCDWNIEEKKKILGTAIGVQNKGKGTGKHQGKWTCKGKHQGKWTCKGMGKK